MHQVNIVHRDIKPDNLLISDKETGRIIIGDYGLARELDANGCFQSTFGYVPYKPPKEELCQNGYTRMTDMWALGLTALDIVTGTFADEHDFVIGQLTNEELQVFLNKIFEEKEMKGHILSTIISQLLKRDATKRITADELVALVDEQCPELKPDTSKFESQVASLQTKADQLQRLMKHIAGLEAQVGNTKETDERVTDELQQSKAFLLALLTGTGSLPKQPVVSNEYPNFDLSTYHNDHIRQYINTDYPGLQMVHQNPPIFIVDKFFTPDECLKVTKKGAIGMKPSASGRFVSGKGVVMDNKNRNAMETRCPFQEIPTLLAKYSLLTNTSVSQMEPLKISAYHQHGFFKKHHDWWRGVNYKIARIATVLVYLNTVAEGGETEFTELGKALKIKPKEGQALVFFPAFLPDSPLELLPDPADFYRQGGQKNAAQLKFLDPRLKYRDSFTMHQGNPVEENKIICQMWIRSKGYDGSKLQNQHREEQNTNEKGEYFLSKEII